MSKLAIYTTSSGKILGTKTNDLIVGILLQSDLVTEHDFAELIIAKQRDNLTEITIGANSTVSKRKLSPVERVARKVVKARFAEASSMTDSWTLEQVYASLLGK